MDRGTLGVLALVAIAVAGCESPAPDPAGGSQRPTTTAEGPQRYVGVEQVVETPKHGPQLCDAGDYVEPPDCSGPEILGWDWAKVRAETQDGTSWGRYEMVVTFDGERFAVAGPVKPMPLGSEKPEDPRPESTTPCEEPAGGWGAVDSTKMSGKASWQMKKRAKRSPEFAGLWLDRVPNPRQPVVNVAFTGDLDGREQWLREVWGGPLCVVPAKRTYRHLLWIHQSISEQMWAGDQHIIGVGPEVVTNQVEVDAHVVTPELQAEFDRRYGEGTVKITGTFEPVR